MVVFGLGWGRLFDPVMYYWALESPQEILRSGSSSTSQGIIVTALGIKLWWVKGFLVDSD